MSKFSAKEIKTIEIKDENDKPIKGAEKLFADWMLKILKKGGTLDNPSTQYKIVVAALNSTPKGLAMFRNRESVAYEGRDFDCQYCAWVPKSSSSYGKSNSLRVHTKRKHLSN